MAAKQGQRLTKESSGASAALARWASARNVCRQHGCGVPF